MLIFMNYSLYEKNLKIVKFCFLEFYNIYFNYDICPLGVANVNPYYQLLPGMLLILEQYNWRF